MTFAPPAIRFLASSADPRQGRDAWSSTQAAEKLAAAALFGAPLDLTESFRSGAHGGPSAVRYMSESLETYSPVLDRDLEDVVVHDLGDLQLDGLAMDGALEAIENAMVRAARTAKLAVMLGGEHTGSLAGFRGIKRVFPDAVIVQVDAHLDIRHDYEGELFSHATWLHRVGEEFGFGAIHQVGVRSGDRAEWRTSRDRTAWSSSELALPQSVRGAIGQNPVYVSIDIDVLDPAHAPGTGCPEPGGVTFRELAQFLYGLDDLRVVGLDVMEVSPGIDGANITAAAAAKLVREAVLLFGTRGAE
ncbi:MAG: agmatinase [Chloroflexi bacterium]|nr:agmatinase [Chloroflexota bacterium]